MDKNGTPNVTIVYASKHGNTADISAELAQSLTSVGVTVELVNLTLTPTPRIAEGHGIVLAAPIYAGMLYGRLVRFCVAHEAELVHHPIWLMASCIVSTDKVTDIVSGALPSGLVARIEEIVGVGGRITLEKLGFIERFIATKVAKVREDVDTINHSAIQSLAERIAGELASTE